MENLAGKPTSHVTETVLHEMKRCGITPYVDPAFEHVEVKTKTRGRVDGPLGEVLFHRNWYYWVAHGPVPLEAAKKLYENPIGRHEVRVDGHCGCPAPEGMYVNWRLPDGVKVLRMKDKVSCEETIARGSTDLMLSICRGILVEHAFSDDPASLGAIPYVDCYHIDSELGLYIFVRALNGKDF